MTNTSNCKLYLITPPKFDPKPFLERVKGVFDAGPVACMQLRLKNVEDDAIKMAAEMLLPVCHSYETPLIMNDRPDLAIITGCDGVHIGQEDTDYETTRITIGQDRIIGVTCKNSRHLAVEAVENGAEYVAFGAFFTTNTKQGTTPAELETVRWWNEMTTVPSVVIGGITIENCRPLISAGADFLAIVGGVWDHPEGEAAAVKAFNKAFENST